MVLAATMVAGGCENDGSRWEEAPGKWNPHYLDAMETDTSESPLGRAAFMSLAWRGELRSFWSLCERVLEIPATAKHVIIVEEMMADHPDQYAFVLVAEYDDQIVACRGPTDPAVGAWETESDHRVWAAIEGVEKVRIRPETWRRMLKVFKDVGVYGAESQTFPPGHDAEPAPDFAPYMIHVYRGRDGCSRQFVSEYVELSPNAIRGDFSKRVLVDPNQIRSPWHPSEDIDDETPPELAEDYRLRYKQWREEFERRLPARTVVNGVQMLLYDAGRQKLRTAGSK
jgi:hypothetical protein